MLATQAPNGGLQAYRQAMSTSSTPRDSAGRPIDSAGRPVDDSTYTAPAARDDYTARTSGELAHSDALVLENRRFRGVKFGSAFFGWLTAFGAAALLTALVGAIGAAIGVNTGTTVDEAADAAAENAETVGIVSIIAVAVVLFVAYLAGGYVAGRMARFSGALQGLAVWLWGIVIALIIALLTMLAGARWDVFAAVDGFPRLPTDATTTGIISAIVAAAVSLGGAILGGVLGMRYHRRVDRLGVDERSTAATDGTRSY